MGRERGTEPATAERVKSARAPGVAVLVPTLTTLAFGLTTCEHVACECQVHASPTAVQEPVAGAIVCARVRVAVCS